MIDLCGCIERQIGRSQPRFMALSLLFYCALFAGVVKSWGADEPNDDWIGHTISEVWQTSDGLPHNDVCGLAQTSDGYIWIGTPANSNAVVRFNGAEFTPLDSSGDMIGHGKVKLVSGKKGRLWISRPDNPNLLVLRQCGSVERIAISFPNALPDRRISLYEDPQENLWIGGGGLLVRTPDGTITDLTAGMKMYREIRQIATDKDGTVWMATAEGLVRYRNGVFDRPYPITNAMNCLFVSKDGNLWVGADYLPQLFKISPSGVITEIGPSQGLDSRGLTAITEDKQHNIWVGTYSGLFRVVGDKTHRIQLPILKAAFAFCLLCDREGSLWVGTSDGVYRLHYNPVDYYGAEAGIGSVSSLSVGPSGIWVSIFAGGVYFQTNKVWKKRLDTLDGSGDCRVLETSRGDVWFSTELSCYRISQGNIKEVPGVGGKAWLYDDGQSLWAVNATNMFSFQDGQFVPMGEGWPAMDITYVVTNQNRGLLIGTSQGLFRWDGRLVRWLELGQAVPGLRINSIEWDGAVLWLATDKAIARHEQGRWETIKPEAGLIKTGGINSMAVEESGLWLGCDNGLFLLSRNEAEQCLKGKASKVSVIQYGKTHGIRSGYFGTISWCQRVARSSGGKLCFATKSGVVVVNTKQLMSDDPPRVLIESVQLDRRPVTNCLSLNQESINVSPGMGSIDIYYAALTYIAPGQVNYKHRLLGLDTNWTMVGNSRIASFTRLPPGEYEFQVLARGADGVWNENAASVRLIQEPFFHQTRAFVWLCWTAGFVAVGGVAMLIAAIAHKISTGRMRKKLAALEAQQVLERERARIARDIHDDVGSTLTRIALLSELANREPSQTYTPDGHLASIRTAAREATQRLDEIVWAINPRNDTLDSLVSYVCKMMTEQCRAAGLRCRLDLPPSVPAWPITGVFRHNLFLACKEALNNAIKHASATQIEFRLTATARGVLIQIRDDGVGMSVSRQISLGDGLGNLRERLASIGGSCEFGTSPNGGAVVSFNVPVPNAADSVSPK